MSKKRNLRKRWTPEQEAILMACVARGRSLKTAINTARVKLNRTYAACMRQYYVVRSHEALKGEGRPLITAAEPQALTGKFLEIRIEGDVLHVTAIR